jgi:formylglycine-generating enzyme required for sulfatase activity
VAIARRPDGEPVPQPEMMVNVRLGVSPFGVHHMAGHVRQWCRDWFAPDFYSRPAATKADPANREATDVKTERGGGGGHIDAVHTCSHRRGRPPQSRSRLLGFRCVGHADEL